MNNKELKKKECLFEIADDHTNGMDIYNHNGSFWLINTKELKWMVEFTKDKTLWYNYHVFKSLFKAMSLDVMKNQEYITEWFESRFLKPEVVEDTIQNGVKHTYLLPLHVNLSVEDTIQNGVKHTGYLPLHRVHPVEDTIQNGVKHTLFTMNPGVSLVEDTIQNGVKRTLPESIPDSFGINDTIQNGVRQTRRFSIDSPFSVKDTIQNGVKINGIYVGGKRQKENVEVVIDYGVKETYDDCSYNIARVEGIVRIGGVIKNGIKEVQRLPDQDGVKQTELSKRDFFPEDILQNGVKHIFNRTRPDNFDVEDTIQNGVKHTKSMCGKRDLRVNSTIENGVKHTEEGLFITISDIKDVTQNGVKHTEYGDWLDGDERIGDIAQNGVKVLQPLPDQDGNMDWGNYYHGKEDRTKPFNEYLNDAIRFGDQVLFPHNFNKLKNLQQ